MVVDTTFVAVPVPELEDPAIFIGTNGFPCFVLGNWMSGNFLCIEVVEVIEVFLFSALVDISSELLAESLLGLLLRLVLGDETVIGNVLPCKNKVAL